MVYQFLRCGRLLLQCTAGTSQRKVLRLRGFNSSATLSSAVKYTKDHEWVKLDGNKAMFGITNFAQEQLGDVVYVELPEVGNSVKQGDVIGTVESVKAVSDIFAPLTGTITNANTQLTDEPSTINQSPLIDGWIAEFSVNDSKEFNNLLSEEQYNALLEE